MTADVSITEQADAAPKSLWKHRDFMLLWSGQTVSELGSTVSQLALPLIAVTVIKATTFEVSVLGFLTSLAFLPISLPAGVIVDRVRKRGLMLWCDVARMVLMASIPVAAVFWHVTLWQLYVVATAVGVLTVFFDVAYQSYLPVLIDRDQLVDGNGKLGTTQSIAQFAGPSLGGALVGLIGAAKTITADAVSYAVSTLSLALIRIPEPRAKPTRARPALELSPFQPVERDFAFVVDRAVRAGDVARAAQTADRKLIANVNVFDVYEGEGIAPGKKSIAIAVTLQPRDKTMTDQEIDAVAAKIVAEVAKRTGGTLRA